MDADPNAVDASRTLVVRGRRGTPDADRLATRALLDRVADTGQPAVRVWAPHRIVAFGRRDARSAGFEDAAAAAREHGFAPVERSVGGRAVAYDGETTLAFARITPLDDVRGGAGGGFGAGHGNRVILIVQPYHYLALAEKTAGDEFRSDLDDPAGDFRDDICASAGLNRSLGFHEDVCVLPRGHGNFHPRDGFSDFFLFRRLPDGYQRPGCRHGSGEYQNWQKGFAHDRLPLVFGC
jgi:hypothetical protein